MRKIVLIILGIFACLQMQGQGWNEVIRGIWFIQDDEDKRIGIGPNNYKGDFVIPSSIMVQGKKYPVEVIWNDAFLNSDITSITMPNSITGIGQNAFEMCFHLQNVQLSASLKSINKKVFSACNDLQSIVIPDSVTVIRESAFEGCTALRTVLFPRLLKKIEYGAFRDCTALTNVILPEGIEEIGKSAFYNCKNLQELSIPSTVNNIKAYAFCCQSPNLREIKCNNEGEGYKSIDGVLYHVDGEVKELVSWPGGKYPINIPDSTTWLGYGSFENNQNLQEIVIPNSVTCILNEAFMDCKNLKSVKLSENVDDIYPNAFNGCTSLESITLPAALNNISRDAFKNSGLKSIVCLGDKLPNVEDDGGIASWVKIYVKDELVDDYKFSDTKPWCNLTILPLSQLPQE